MAAEQTKKETWICIKCGKASFKKPKLSELVVIAFTIIDIKLDTLVTGRWGLCRKCYSPESRDFGLFKR